MGFRGGFRVGGFRVLARRLRLFSGSLKVCWKKRPFVGVVPAGAGSALGGDSGGYEKGDHPRLCGVCFKVKHEQIRRTGSPPLVRGLRKFVGYGLQLPRITHVWSGSATGPGMTNDGPTGYPQPTRGHLSVSEHSPSGLPLAAHLDSLLECLAIIPGSFVIAG